MQDRDRTGFTGDSKCSASVSIVLDCRLLRRKNGETSCTAIQINMEKLYCPFINVQHIQKCITKVKSFNKSLNCNINKLHKSKQLLRNRTDVF